MTEENRIKSLIDTIIQDRNISGNSEKWANWKSVLSITTCLYCAAQHGKIFDISSLSDKLEIHAHPNCKCVYVPMRTKEAGTATDEGRFGTDMYLILFGKLPDKYIGKEQAKAKGWRNNKGNLNKVLPG